MALAPHIRKRLEAEAVAAAATEAAVNNTCSAGPPPTTINANEHHTFDTPTSAPSVLNSSNFATTPASSPMSVPASQIINSASSNDVVRAVAVGLPNQSEANRSATKAAAPPRVLCASCKTIKPKDQFAPKQLERVLAELRRNSGFHTTQWALISCVACNTGPTETKCAGCDRFKAKSSFNRTQWRKRAHGTAMCEVCMEERANAELPDLQEEDLAHNSSSDSEGGGAPLAGSSGGSTIEDSDESEGGEDYTMPASLF